jgi:hypothetical protein
MPPLLEQLQSIARQTEQQATTRVNELLPHVRSGRLTPEEAVNVVRQKGEQLASAVQASSTDARRQAQQTVRSTTNRVVERAEQALTAANAQRQHVADTAIATMLDPVAAALPAAPSSPLPPPATGSPLLATAIGAGIGALVASATEKTVSAWALGGGLIGLGWSLLTARR